MTEFRIDISKPKQAFADHLILEDNKRIIFSGPFGIGKTTFIKEFSEINKEKYNVIHLFPVNYSVSSNEDIFELIKYDLFYEILKFEPIVDQTSISKLEHLPFFAKQEFNKLIHIFLNAIPKIGKPISEVLKDLDALVGKFKEEHDALNKTEFNHIASFIEEMSESKGSIYEFDFYSSLIKSLLENIKSAKEEGRPVKENILVIDDLDRVDPDHLFRLLNVFAAHVDFDKEEDNKFGFEKVIFVLDIKNVHNIFQNRYGQGVDFSGYLDKFFSIEVFHYDNNSAIDDSLNKIIDSINSEHKAIELGNRGNLVRIVFIFLVRAFRQVDVLNLRALMKMNTSTYEPPSYSLRGKSDLDIESSNSYFFCLLIDLAIRMLGTEQALRKAIDVCVDYSTENWIIDSNDQNYKSKIAFLIPILQFGIHDFDNDQERSTLIRQGLRIDYVLRRVEGYCIARNLTFKDDKGENIEIYPHQFFSLLKEALDRLRFLKN